MPLAQDPLFDENIRHDSSDEYWKARDISQHLYNIHCPRAEYWRLVDAEDLAGISRTYQAITDTNPGSSNFLVMGPLETRKRAALPDRKLGPLNCGSDTGAYFRTNVLFTFFERHLQDAPAPDLPGALAFETGANQWQRYPSRPPPGAQPRSLSADCCIWVYQQIELDPTLAYLGG